MTKPTKAAQSDLETLATGSMFDIERLRAEFWAQPSIPRTILEYARTLTIPDTEDERGNLEQYDPASHPAQWHAIQALDGEYGHFREFTLLADTQDGKSFLMQVAMFHSMLERGINHLFAIPNRNMGADIWTTKLRPSIIGSGNERFLPTEGPASRAGSNPRSVPFKRVNGKGGGLMQVMSGAGRGESGQAALSARHLNIDELDDWQRSAVERVERRLDKFMSSRERRIIRGTTVKGDSFETSTGLQYYKNSCRGTVAYACEKCGAYTRFLWSTFDSDNGTIACEHCQALINDATRKRMMVNHELHMEQPDHKHFGLKWTALDCPWKDLSDLTDKYNSTAAMAQLGVHEPMKQFHRDQMVEPYEDDLEVRNIERSHLAMRSTRSDYTKGIVPAWADFVTYGGDVQMDRAYWLALAVGLDGRYAIIDWGEEYFKRTEDGQAIRKVEPTDGERAIILDQITDDLTSGMLQNEELDAFPATLGGFDMGYKPEAIGAWIKSRGKDVWAVRGDKPKKSGRVGRQIQRLEGQAVRTYNGGLLTKRRQKRKAGMPSHWWFIRSKDTRDRVRAGLLLPSDKPGAICLPRGVGSEDDLARHLSCWRLEADKTDASVNDWVKRGARDDLEDCLIYAWNIARYILETKYKVKGGTPRDDDDDTPDPVKAKPRPPRPSGGGGGFIAL